MMQSGSLYRRRWLLRSAMGGAALLLAGCEKLSQSAWFPKLLSSAEKLNLATQRTLQGRKALAQEFSEADMSPSFRSNGTAVPNNPSFLTLANSGFADYRLQIDGLVERPAT